MGVFFTQRKLSLLYRTQLSLFISIMFQLVLTVFGGFLLVLLGCVGYYLWHTGRIFCFFNVGTDLESIRKFQNSEGKQNFLTKDNSSRKSPIEIPLLENQKFLVEKKIKEMFKRGIIKKVSQCQDRLFQNQFWSNRFFVKKRIAFTVRV